jgi:hypothetical protein
MDLKVDHLTDIEILHDQHLGSGFSSVVKLGRHIPTNATVAVKIVL